MRVSSVNSRISRPPHGKTLAHARFRRRGSTLIYWLILVAILAYVVWFTIILGGQEYIIFVRALWPAPFFPVERPAGVESVWLTMSDGRRVEGWYRAGEGRSGKSPGPAVMYFHGNGNIIDTRWGMVRPYVEGGVSALTMEYRGYGRTRGMPTQKRVVEDAEAFYDWLRQRPEVGSQPIIFDGQSIGAAVAGALAEKRKPAAMVLEAAFTSMQDIGRRLWLPGWLTRQPFRTEAVLATLDVPILICQGRYDWLVPMEQAERLRAAARRSQLVVLECGHVNFKSSWGVILQFLKDEGIWPGR